MAPYPKIYTHALASPTTVAPPSASPLAHALATLRPHLPVSLPLYRRLQLHPTFSPASTLLTNLDLTRPRPHTLTRTSEDAGEDEAWVMCFLDRSRRPETEVWVFGSWESSLLESRQSERDVEALLLALLKTIKDLPVPRSMHRPASNSPEADRSEEARKEANMSPPSDADTASQPSDQDPTLILWGAVPESTLSILQRLSVLHPQFPIVGNSTFLFQPARLPHPASAGLPTGLIWGEVRRQDYPLVLSRTSIPRQERTMAALPSQAIYADEKPVAWAFVGLDGSLTTLHVEPPWRGRGLAKLLTAKLLREKMGAFEEKEVEMWGHGYVVEGNGASEGVCRSLGGVRGWVCYWLRVDLNRVRS